MTMRTAALGRHDGWLLVKGDQTAGELSDWTRRCGLVGMPPAPCGRGWLLAWAVLDDARAAHVADRLSMGEGGLLLQVGRGGRDGVVLAEPGRPARALTMGSALAGLQPEDQQRTAAVVARWLERHAPRRPPADAAALLRELLVRERGRDLLRPLLHLGGWRPAAARAGLGRRGCPVGLVTVALGASRPRTAW